MCAFLMLYEISIFWANFKHCFQIKCKTLITFFAVWVDEVTQQQLSFPSFYWLPFIVSAWFTPPWHFTIKKAVLVDLIMLHYQGRKKEKKIVVELSSLVLYSLLVKLGGTVRVTRAEMIIFVMERNKNLMNLDPWRKCTRTFSNLIILARFTKHAVEVKKVLLVKCRLSN